MGTKESIFKFIKNESQTTVHQIWKAFGIQKPMIHRHLKKLIQEQKVQKTGSPPFVFYCLEKTKPTTAINTASQIIEKNFFEVLPNGDFLEGIDGFVHWCNVRNANLENKKTEYEKIFAEKNEVFSKWIS